MTSTRPETRTVHISDGADGGIVAVVRGHRVMLDESPRFGGHDLGANPVEHMLAGLAAVSLVVLRILAGTSVPTITGLEIEAELNIGAVLGDDGGAVLRRIALEWQVAGPPDRAAVELLLPELARRRPGQALIDAAGESVERVVCVTSPDAGEVVA